MFTKTEVLEECKTISTIHLEKHVKIWFSVNPDEWMPMINRLRLIRHKSKNPTHELALVGAKRMLSESSQLKLDKFCLEHKINYLDIDTDLPKIMRKQSDSVSREQDLLLLKIANEELNRCLKTNAVGYTAMASDVLRWSSALLNLGCYSDLDTEISFKDQKVIEADFLIPAYRKQTSVNDGSAMDSKVSSSSEKFFVNSNFVASSKESLIPAVIRSLLLG